MPRSQAQKARAKIRKALREDQAKFDGIAIVYRAHQKRLADMWAEALEATGGDVWNRHDYYLGRFGRLSNGTIHVWEVEGTARNADDTIMMEGDQN